MSSEETTLKREVNAVFLVVSRDGQQKDYSAKQVRAALQQRGWQCSQEQWESKWRKVVKEEWHSLLPSSDAGSEQEEPEDVKVATPAKRKPKNKYDAAAERNLGNFIGMVAGDLLGGGGEDDEDDYDSSEMAASDSGVGSPSVGDEEEKEPAAPSSTKSTSSSKSKDNEKSTTTKSKGKRKAAEEQEEGDDESEAASESKPKRAPAKKKKKVSPKAAKIKSAEYISDSDEEASGSATPSVGGDGAPVKKSKASSSGSKGNDKKPAKKKGSPKQPKALKEGEQRKGTAEEEARVKKLKNLLNLAGASRPFNKNTGAEKTLTISARLAHLEKMLNDLGLSCGSGVGTKMPSEAKAKERGEAAQLADEMKDLKGAPSLSGLRGGKKRVGIARDQEEPEEEEAPRKPFGAFLKAVQSSSESD